MLSLAANVVCILSVIAQCQQADARTATGEGEAVCVNCYSEVTTAHDHILYTT